MLHPLPGYALVELGSKYKNLGDVPTKSYDGATTGVLISLGGEWETYPDAVGKTVYWEELVTGTRVQNDGKIYVMPRVTDLRSYDE